MTSHLYLATAAAADSGKYTCAVGKLARAKLSLHILNGESVNLSAHPRPSPEHCHPVNFHLSPGEEPAAIQSSRAGKGGRGARDLLLAFAGAVFFPMLVPHFEA